MTVGQMIKKGMIIEVGEDYLTDDNRIIKRTYVGRSATPKWLVEVEGHLYLFRNLFEAYNEMVSWAKLVK